MKSVKLTLIGGPTVLIEIGGFRLLTDPTFDARGSYEVGGITLRKTTGPALPLESVLPVDAVLLSHDQHMDNLDRSGRLLLPRAQTVLTTKVGAERLGGNARGMLPWEKAELRNSAGGILHVTATPARHGPPGVEKIAGDVVGFALGLEEPGDAIYITGDSVWYEGVADVAVRFKPRIVILFAGSAKPRGPFHLTMDGNDAVETANAFSTAQIVGVHNEGWGHFTEDETQLGDAFRILGFGSRLQNLERGQATTLSL